jgi:adhesin HecA-like repeat protein
MLMSRLLSRLIEDRRGSIAPFFALAVIPVIGFVGAAVDYSRGNAAKASMQAALDSTGLMLSKEATSLNAQQLTQKAGQYFAALFHHTDTHNVQLTPTLTTLANGNYQLDIAGSGKVDTTFIRILGKTDMSIGTSTRIVWGFKKLELALALDNTGSMSSSGKMTALKTASHSLLNIMQTAAKSPGDIKISIIPFDTTVKVGQSYYNQSWIDWTNWDANHGSWQSCGGGGWGGGGWGGGGWGGGGWGGGGWGGGGSCWVPNNHNTWQGCVRDRTQQNDALDTAPVSGNTATLFPAFDCGSLVQAMPLSYDWTALHNKIDQMTPNGNTNVTIGLAWGWHSLTSNQPFNEGAAPAPNLDKVLLILTDGQNTEAWNNQTQSTITSQATLDARTAQACTNIKAAGIKIYAIRVIDGNASLLQSCATNPGMYYDVQDPAQLDSVFKAIAESLANLRIAR